MSRKQVVICLFIVVSSFTVKGQATRSASQNKCITPTNRPGECINLRQCPTIVNALRLKAFNEEVGKQYFSKALCRYENKMPIICCEKDAGACATENNKPGSCIPLKRCEAILEFLTKKPFINDEAVLYTRSAECQSGNDKKSRVCCPLFSNEIPNPIYDEVITSDSGSKPVTSEPPAVDDWPWSKIKTPKVNLPTPGEEAGHCGIQEFAERIIGGNVTALNQFPWMALLQMGDGVLACGGSLINNRYVLTAAHCVTGPRVEQHKNLASIRLGEWDSSLEYDCIQSEGCTDEPLNIDVEEIIYHPLFSLRTLQHDIALVRLKSPAPYTEFIRPICLSTKPIETPKELYVAGWGRTEIAVSSNVKLYIKIPYYDKQKCTEKYGALKTSPKINIGRGQFCAGGIESQDSCTGDSGGPAMIDLKVNSLSHVYFQLGVVSFGPQICGLPDRPGVYTKIEEYMGWILENLRP